MDKIDQVFTYASNTCQALVQGFYAKCAGAIGMLLLEFSFGSIGFNIVVAVIFLIIIDTITGVIAAKKQNEVISSKRFFDSVVKLLLFPLIIAAGVITQTAIGTEILMLPQIIAGYLAVHEFLSIVENFGRIGYKIPQQLLNKEIFSKVIGGNVTNTTSTSTNDTN